MKKFLRYIALMFVQVVLLNELQLFGLCHPFLYMMVLLMMPIRHLVVVDMLIGAAMGLVMDFFCNTPGVHMAACVLIAYLRRKAIPSLVFEPERLQDDINIQSIGARPFMQLAIYLILVHHFVVFLLGAWSLSLVGWALLQTLVSGVLTWLLIMLYNAILMRPRR